MPKISSIRPVVSTQYQLVADGLTDRQTDGHMTTANTAWKNEFNLEQCTFRYKGK